MRIGFQPALKSQPGRSVDGVDGGREAFQEQQPSATGGANAASSPFLFFSPLEKDNRSSAEHIEAGSR